MADNATRPSPEEIVLYEKDKRTKIATITLNRPDTLNAPTVAARHRFAELVHRANVDDDVQVLVVRGIGAHFGSGADRPEEHTSELQSLMRISYAVFCLKKNK